MDLDEQGYAFAGHFSELCSETSVAAAGVTVVLDGGAQAVTDASGRFVFEGVAPGAHSIDVLGAGVYADTLEPVDVDVYPGTRVVIAVDPLANPGDGDGDDDPTTGDSGDGDGGECWIGEQDCACTPGGGCDPGLVCDASNTCVPEGEGGGGGEEDPTGDEAEGGTGSGDPGLDYLEAESCSVNDADERPGLLGLALLGLLGLGLRRRGR